MVVEVMVVEVMVVEAMVVEVTENNIKNEMIDLIAPMI